MQVIILRYRFFIFVAVASILLTLLVLSKSFSQSSTPTKFLRTNDNMEHNPDKPVSSTSNDRKVMFVGKKAEVEKGLSRPQAKQLNNKNQNRTLAAVSYNVHIFYYAWYGNPSNDGEYLHWNHKFIEHWDSAKAKLYAKYKGRHQPPDDVGANFYPSLGPYSSWDKNIIDDHMKQLRFAGVGVIVLSWYPPGKSDTEGKPSDTVVLPIMIAAAEYDLKVAFHIEPYKDRTADSVLDDVKYIIDTYGQYPAFYKCEWRGHKLPMFYVYDSYLIHINEWRKILSSNEPNSIRKTKYDAVFVALIAEQAHKSYVTSGGFDGLYTYFGADGFTYGSRREGWKDLQRFALQSSSLFIPSIAPGYIDTRVRPWNGENTRDRLNGQYYEKGFQVALATNPNILSITSFNEWHEGTQIEKCAPKAYEGFTYLDYTPQKPDYYLKLTRKWVNTLMKKQTGRFV